MLGKISIQESKKLTAFYLKQERKVKALLKLAIEKGNSQRYLNSILLNIQKEIRTLQRYNAEFAQLSLFDIGSKQSDAVDAAIKIFDKRFDIESTFGGVNQTGMRALSANTGNSLENVALAMGRNSKDVLRRIGLNNAAGIVRGTDTWQQVKKQMTKELEAKKMFTIKYKLKNGKFREVPADVYSQMVARTTAAEAFRISTHERILAWGYDLVDVIGRSSWPTSPCIPYQGQTLSITGQTAGYVALEEARAQGFNHPNCIHTTVFSSKNSELLKKGG